MKKKIYLISYAIVQIVVSIYMMICTDSLVSKQMEAMENTFKMFPVEIQTMMTEMYSVETIRSSFVITAVAGIVLALILLWIFLKDKVSKSKGLALGLTIASALLFGSGIVAVMAIVGVILIAMTPKDVTVKKEKKEIQKLRALKVTKKDLLWVIVLVLAYCSQFFVADFINSVTLAIIFDVCYNVLIFSLVIYIFNKRLKRDFSAFKNNIGGYVGYIFKWWGIMLGLSLIAGIIRMIFGGAIETANQNALNNMPLWYVGPLAIVWAPVVEEGIFRGGLRRFIKNDKLFIILSAVLFGLLHTIGTEAGLYNILIQSLQYMVMGFVMAYTYTKTNNIFVNMGIHCVQNTVGVLAMVLTSII